MVKGMLHLSIETDLIELAKQSGLNLSKEFEEWIKIRLGNIEEDKPTINVDLEIAKHQAEIQKLKNQAEIIKTQEMKGQEEIMVIDQQIANMEEFREGKEWKDFINDSRYGVESRIHGIQFLFQKKFNKVLNPLEAQELLENRLKERGFV
jgi:hypothetical protein